MWFDFVNNYFLFRLEEGKMEQKYVVVTIQIWEGHEVNWYFIVQQRSNEEIQVRKAQSPPSLYLYSIFCITCLCELPLRSTELTPPRPSPVKRLLSPPSPTSKEIEAQLAIIISRMAELQK